MSWIKLMRSIEADARRHRKAVERRRRAEERDALRSFREQQRAMKAYEKAEEAERAAREASAFDAYLKLLVSVHKDCGERWDWQALSRAADPSPPSRIARNEDEARRALDGYSPSFFEKLFGRAKKRRSELEGRVDEARRTDDREHRDRLQEHRSEVELAAIRRRIAAGILACDPNAYRAAIEHASPFEELDSYDTTVDVTDLQADVAVLRCEIKDREVVPTEELKLTATGKLSKKQMAAGKYWALYQDYVCSCAIRVAREVFAVLPVNRVITNICTTGLDPSTGHHGLTTLLTVGFGRSQLAHLNLAAIDPSDAMENFPHRMTFKKTAGLQPVEPIAVDDGWVTTA